MPRIDSYGEKAAAAEIKAKSRIENRRRNSDEAYRGVVTPSLLRMAKERGEKRKLNEESRRETSNGIIESRERKGIAAKAWRKKSETLRVTKQRRVACGSGNENEEAAYSRR